MRIFISKYEKILLHLISTHNTKRLRLNFIWYFFLPSYYLVWKIGEKVVEICFALTRRNEMFEIEICNNRIFGKKKKKNSYSDEREIQIFAPFISVSLEKRLLGVLCSSTWYFIDYYTLYFAPCPILFAFDQHFIPIFARFCLTNI